MARLFDADPLTGSREYFHYDESSDQAFIETVADVSPVIEDVASVRQQEEGGWKGDFHRVASIPLPVWLELEKQGIAHDDELLKRWMNDNLNLKLRTKLGRV